MAATDLFRSMIAYWKEFDLQKLQGELDRTASTLAVQCEETDLSRQILLQKSREFKRNCSEEIQKATAPLLKSFQTEIDGLLRRSKLAESAFLSTYKKLVQMPDMMPVLVAAEQLRSEVERLRDCHSRLCEHTQESENEGSKCSCNKRRNSASKDEDDHSHHTTDCDKTDEEISLNYPNYIQNNSGMERWTEAGTEESMLSQSSGANDKTTTDFVNSSIVLSSDVQNGESSIENPCDDDDVTGIDLRPHKTCVDLRSRNDDGSGFCVPESLQNEKTLRYENDADQTERTASCSSGVNLCRVGSNENENNICAIDLKIMPSDAADVPDQVEIGANDSNCVLAPNSEKIEDSYEAHEEDKKETKDCSDQVAQEVDTEVVEDEVNEAEDSLFLNATREKKSIDQDADLSDAVGCEQEHQDVELDESNNWHDEQVVGSEFGVANRWQCQQETARQSSSETDTSLNSVAEVDSHTSEISQEAGRSDHIISLYPQPIIWRPDTNIDKTENFSFLPLAHSHGSLPSPYPSDYSIGHSDGLKAEVLDGTMPLDTMEVAQRIREILSFHNLGQRLFARYVLGLSQGTVSELLSKPKHWEKLTEKGRESYRKMHQWAGDERNIQMLKSLSSPKCNVSSSSSGRNDPVAEERIAQILSEAQAAMLMKQEDPVEQLQFSQAELTAPRVFDPYSRMSSQVESESKERGPRKLKGSRKANSSAAGSRNETSKNRKMESENLTREIVARIYQEELEKLAQVAEASGNVVELVHYRQELARLSQGWARRPGKADAHKVVVEDKENHDEAMEEKPTLGPKKLIHESMERMLDNKVDADLPQDLSMSGSAEALHHTALDGSAGSVVRANASPMPVPSISSNNGLMSPLQRMQSIANSLMLQIPTSSSQAMQPSRAVLPPISQEQFDMYANISTDELVKRVKDVLSQYSISQRLFGEYVLGLSQGSVSDLLARPKPWHLLTQKGREPFIRMQMFVDDSESVQKLVASQYRVPTEKLLHGNSTSQLDATSCGVVTDGSTEMPKPCDFSAPTSRSSTPFRTPTLAVTDATLPRSNPLPSSSVFSAVSSSPTTVDSVPATFDKSLNSGGVSFPSMGVAMVPSVLSLFGATFLPSAQFGPLLNVDLHHVYSGAGSPDIGPGNGGPELDTQAITARVKEVLQLNNLGQKLFGEAVLELSQGSVSELLSKPKPWHMLSLKGREPFVKMQIWLNDPLGVQKLLAYQTHMAGRRRKSGCDGPSSEKAGNQKKPRLFFSEEQKEALKAAYLRDPYPNQVAIEQLAGELDIGVKTVINWFHNHRMRAKQHQNCNSPTSTTAGSPSSSALGRIKSELPEDASEVSGPPWMAFPLEENSTGAPKTSRSKCDSATPTVDGRLERRSSSSKIGSSCCSPAKNDGECKRRETNKRKRARPHRLYDGASAVEEFQAVEEFRTSVDMALDLSINRSNDTQRDHPATMTGDFMKIETQSEKLDDREDGETSAKPQAMDIEQDSSMDNWSDVCRIKNIEKLQQNLLLAPSDDWEF